MRSGGASMEEKEGRRGKAKGGKEEIRKKRIKYVNEGKVPTFGSHSNLQPSALQP